MAKASKKTDKQKKKELIAGLVGGGFVCALYASIFGFTRPIHLLIGIPLSILAGWAVSVMARPLDTHKKAPEQHKDPIPVTGNAYADDMIARGQQLMKEIREENEQIPDAHLTEQIVKLDEVTDKLFRAVAEQPGKAPQIRRSMDYYLPTTLKMLSGYRVMDERNVKGDMAEKTRRQIHDAMDIVVTAFSRQLDTMYQADVLDISTDIDVLETLLKQDGLLENVMRRAPQPAKETKAEDAPAAEEIPAEAPFSPSFSAPFSGGDQAQAVRQQVKKQ
ncbi:MAG: 5-bromo-4-chloroindolyl phosphate hydrolysis family protein [Clostridia bacterium]|nr:5-bromo-4-chloroindolyl phosphate hydrolysis family protein [Clostridia bacterium]